MFAHQLTEGQVIRTIAALSFVEFAQDNYTNPVIPTESVQDVKQQLENDYIDYLCTNR